MSIHAHRKPPAVLMGQPSLWPGEAVKPVEPTPTPDADAGEAAATAVPTHAKPGRRRTPSFVCEVPLRVGPAEEQALQARLEAARALYNACLEEARRRWGLLRQSKAYQQARRLPRHTPERTEAFNAARAAYGFRDAALQVYAKECRHASRWIEEHLDAPVSQKLATRAYRAVVRVAVGHAKRVRFKGKPSGCASRASTSWTRWKGRAMRPAWSGGAIGSSGAD